MKKYVGRFGMEAVALVLTFVVYQYWIVAVESWISNPSLTLFSLIVIFFVIREVLKVMLK